MSKYINIAVYIVFPIIGSEIGAVDALKSDAAQPARAARTANASSDQDIFMATFNLEGFNAKSFPRFAKQFATRSAGLCRIQYEVPQCWPASNQDLRERIASSPGYEASRLAPNSGCAAPSCSEFNASPGSALRSVESLRVQPLRCSACLSGTNVDSIHSVCRVLG